MSYKFHVGLLYANCSIYFFIKKNPMIYRELLSLLGFVGIKCYQYDKIVQCHPLEMCTLKHGAKSGCLFFSLS